MKFYQTPCGRRLSYRLLLYDIDSWLDHVNSCNDEICNRIAVLSLDEQERIAKVHLLWFRDEEEQS